ncbi:MAG: hypothetical protein O9346_05890 [Leptospiraceae bacterium]|nr:hypothetical protein [Leptospiraceae bacterium]MCZ8345929.1 hypothetical protein [Leptospiraceae bacterium]
MIKNIYLILFLLFVGCAQTKYDLRTVDLNVRISSLKDSPEYKLKQRFELSSTRHNFFWGLSYSGKSLEEILATENVLPSSKAQAIGSLKITESYTFLNSIIDFFTIGIYRPYSVSIEGELYELVSKENEKLENRK